MYTLTICYEQEDIKIIYFTQKNAAKKAYKGLKKNGNAEGAVLAKVIEEFNK